MTERSRFLNELAREAGKGRSTRRVDSLVAEAEAHLNDDVQARLELGSTLEEAEREAVMAFGSARTLGQEVRRRETRSDRRFLFACLGVVATTGGVAAAPVGIPDGVTCALGALIVLAHMAFVAASVVPRRLRAVELAAVLVPLWMGWSVFQAANHVVAPYPISGNDHRMLRTSVPREVRSEREWAARIRRGTPILVAERSAFLRGEGRSSPSRRASFSEDGHPRLFLRADHATALTYWNAAVENGRTSDERIARSLEAQAEALERAARAPWWPNIPAEILDALSEGGWAVAATYGSVHLVAWLLGQALLFRRRWRTLA